MPGKRTVCGFDDALCEFTQGEQRPGYRAPVRHLPPRGWIVSSPGRTRRIVAKVTKHGAAPAL